MSIPSAILDLVQRFDLTDRQIDALVYELYTNMPVTGNAVHCARSSPRTGTSSAQINDVL
ncbi:MAG: hypothetical protein JW934_01600 [Anaerolineae bacterium]|nr:hypothetical protein [Anaerolineae bacterium]